MWFLRYFLGMQMPCMKKALWYANGLVGRFLLNATGIVILPHVQLNIV